MVLVTLKIKSSTLFWILTLLFFRVSLKAKLWKKDTKENTKYCEANTKETILQVNITYFLNHMIMPFLKQTKIYDIKIFELTFRML